MTKTIVKDGRTERVFPKGSYFVSTKGKKYRFEENSNMNESSGIYNVKVSDENGGMWFLKFAPFDSDGKESWQIYHLKRESRFRFFYHYIEHVVDDFCGKVKVSISEDSFIPETYYAVCTEYIEGRTLEEDCINQQKLMDAEELTQEAFEQRMFRHMMQFLYGIDYYTEYAKDAYIHRDLKPLNIMISEKEDKVVIIDFDYAHISGSKATENREEKAKGQGVSNGYISPDAVANGKTDSIAEIYSIGRIFFYWMNGEHYFKSKETEAVPCYFSNFRSCPRYCVELEIGFGLDKSRFDERYQSPKYAKLLKIIEKMCEHPNKRYQTISEIILDMRGFLREYYGSLKEQERCLQLDKMPLLKEPEERNIKKAPMVSWKLLSEEGEKTGVRLLKYSMQKIINDGELIMTIYNIKNVIYYIPALQGKELVRNREGNDFEIHSGDIFEAGDMKMKFSIRYFE